MSEVRADTWKTSLGTQAVSHKGIAKAWGNLNGKSTATLRNNYNLIGITDGGTGIYDFNFTNNMNAADYAVEAMSSSTTLGDANSGIGQAGIANVTTAKSTIWTSFSSNSAAIDPEIIGVAMHGVLA